MVLKALDNGVSEERLTSRFRSQGGPHSDLLSSLAPVAEARLRSLAATSVWSEQRRILSPTNARRRHRSSNSRS